jgi:hypothetical protein
LRAGAGLGVVDLGGCLFKIRIGRENQGKSGGFRTILVFKELSRALFLYGFEKNDLDNIDKKTLSDYKKYAKAFLGYDKKEIQKLLDSGALFPLEEKSDD